MPWYMCVYPAWPHMPTDPGNMVGDYSSFIRAKNLKQAEKLAAQRGLGERVICKWSPDGRKAPYPLPSDLLRKRSLSPKQRMDIIHGTCFLSYLLMQSAKAPPSGILGDEGLLHQVIHSMSFGRPSRKQLIETMIYFERQVPGYR